MVSNKAGTRVLKSCPGFGWAAILVDFYGKHAGCEVITINVIVNEVV